MTTSARPLPGTLIGGDFRIVRHLSDGGMGQVYLAEQLSTGHPRALKVMQPHLASDPRSRQRFVQEARIGARIPSEHVAQVIAAGVDEATGTPWLAMEFLEGEDLGARVARAGPLSLGEAREVFAQLRHALSLAHRAGVVHRDLKPSNIFLAAARRPTAPFAVKVLDFGIARLVHESQGAAQATASVGSPMWMAPEQLDSAGVIGPATDVWALGLLAFFALTGWSYWRAGNVADPRLAALLSELLAEPLPTPSERAAALGLAAAWPADFDAWFAGCVTRDAKARFRDADAALAALDQVLADSAPSERVVAPGSAPPRGAGAARTELGAPNTMAWFPATRDAAHAQQPPTAPAPLRASRSLPVGRAALALAVLAAAITAIALVPRRSRRRTAGDVSVAAAGIARSVGAPEVSAPAMATASSPQAVPSVPALVPPPAVIPVAATPPSAASLPSSAPAVVPSAPTSSPAAGPTSSSPANGAAAPAAAPSCLGTWIHHADATSSETVIRNTGPRCGVMQTRTITTLLSGCVFSATGLRAHGTFAMNNATFTVTFRCGERTGTAGYVWSEGSHYTVQLRRR